MRKLTRIVAPALVAVAVLGTAGAASAQPYPGYGHERFAGGGPRVDAIRSQLNQLEQRVNRNDWRGRISDREAMGIRRELRETRDQFRYFSRDGLNDREFRVLQNRIDHLRDRLRFERHDRDARRW